MTKAANKPADEAAKIVTSETTLPATGTAGATASAAGAITLAADAGGTSETVARDDSSIDPDGRYTVVVQGPVAGRWRIGRKFTAEPTSIPASELTEAQVTALRDDPALMVSVIAAPY